MIEWRNYRRLYPELRQKYEECGREIEALKKTVAEQQDLIEKLLLRVEQLETMVFRRKYRKDDEGHDNRGEGAAPAGERRPLPPSSFRRAVPSSEAVTKREAYAIASCPDCGTPLRKKERVMRFIEDIPLPKKTVTGQTIERGFCPRCRKTHAALPLAPQKSSLGPNVRLYVLYAVTVLGQTFEKVKAHLHGVHDLAISDGEIAEMLDEGHRRLLPARNAIDARIRDAPAAHYDETGYPVQHGDQGNFAWVKASSIGPETVFLLGRTRGKGNAEEIRGPPLSQVAVTDDYGAYGVLFL